MKAEESQRIGIGSWARYWHLVCTWRMLWVGWFLFMTLMWTPITTSPTVSIWTLQGSIITKDEWLRLSPKVAMQAVTALPLRDSRTQIHMFIKQKVKVITRFSTSNGRCSQYYFSERASSVLLHSHHFTRQQTSQRLWTPHCLTHINPSSSASPLSRESTNEKDIIIRNASQQVFKGESLCQTKLWASPGSLSPAGSKNKSKKNSYGVGGK